MKSFCAAAIGFAVMARWVAAASRAPEGKHNRRTRSISRSRAGSEPPAKGSPENFTGAVSITVLIPATGRTQASGASVSFEPGARSAWHSHPAGQTLIVTAGTGWVQESGGKKQELKPGDVVWTPPGVKHWHGATTTEAMTHIALHENVDGKVVDWMEQVGEQEHRE